MQKLLTDVEWHDALKKAVDNASISGVAGVLEKFPGHQNEFWCAMHVLRENVMLSLQRRGFTFPEDKE